MPSDLKFLCFGIDFMQTIERQSPGSSEPVNGPAKGSTDFRVVLSFDVEEHYQIEAARDLAIDPSLKAIYRDRLEPSVSWLLEQLEQTSIKATFFVVGELAQRQPALVRTICRGGHEVASHGWDHQPVTRLAPASFRTDVTRSKDVLEQITGERVVGYRAPTFSILRETSWAIEILADIGIRYDSSIYPVRHDRYGISTAPRAPFRAHSANHALLELPPATWRFMGMNVPVGGGGSFRLFPLWCMKQGLKQIGKLGAPNVAMLYFHPWEFDPDQPRLPLARLARFRTYVGIASNRRRLSKLLACYRFVRAVDVAENLDMPSAAALSRYDLEHTLDSSGPVISIRRENTGEEVTVTPNVA